MPDEIKSVEDAMSAPKKTASPEGSVEERPIGEMIEAENHQAAKTVSSRPSHGLTISRVKPGGTV